MSKTITVTLTEREFGMLKQAITSRREYYYWYNSDEDKRTIGELFSKIEMEWLKGRKRQ